MRGDAGTHGDMNSPKTPLTGSCESANFLISKKSKLNLADM
jgi:hypothetical protein